MHAIQSRVNSFFCRDRLPSLSTRIIWPYTRKKSVRLQVIIHSQHSQSQRKTLIAHPFDAQPFCNHEHGRSIQSPDGAKGEIRGW